MKTACDAEGAAVAAKSRFLTSFGMTKRGKFGMTKWGEFGMTKREEFGMTKWGSSEWQSGRVRNDKGRLFR